MQRDERNDARLDSLFRAYRDACPAPEPSANFMPEVWRRIEERQRSAVLLGHWARLLATAGAVLSLGMAVYLYTPHKQAPTLSSESFVEAMASTHSADTPEFAEPLEGPDAPR